MPRQMMRALAALLVALFAVCTPLQAADKSEQKKTPSNPIAIFETNMGKIEIELWPEVAPVTVANFIDYLRDGFYDNTIIHRVVQRGIGVVQGGGFDRELKRKPTSPPIKLEAKESNRKYTIAMARSAVQDSATSQFFINTRDNTQLDPGRPGGGYAVFGKVTKGAGVVDQIARMQTTNKGGAFATIPAVEVFIKRAYIKE